MLLEANVVKWVKTANFSFPKKRNDFLKHCNIRTMSHIVLRNTDNSLIQPDQSFTLQSQNGADSKMNLVQYSSCLSDFQKIQQKKQSVSALPCSKKLLKLAIYSKCQVRAVIYFVTVNSLVRALTDYFKNVLITYICK